MLAGVSYLSTYISRFLFWIIANENIRKRTFSVGPLTGPKNTFDVLWVIMPSFKCLEMSKILFVLVHSYDLREINLIKKK